MKTRTAAIVGIGCSDLHLQGGHNLTSLALDAVNRALTDAGITSDDVDGLTTYSKPAYPTVRREGVNAIGIPTILQNLRPQNVRWACDVDYGLLMASLVEGVNAIESGHCDIVIVWRALGLPFGQYGAASHATASGDDAFAWPYGASAIVPWHALAYARYLNEYDANEESMGALVLSLHNNAQRNMNAVKTKRPRDLADYLSSPYVADPMRRLDCDRPVEGCAAIVLASSDAARQMCNKPAYISALAQNITNPSPALHNALCDTFEVGQRVGRALWTRSGLSPRDIGSAQLYDGFSPTIYYWLEALGFCERGAAHELFRTGTDATQSTKLPLINTFGGSLAEGRLHGMGHLIEGARQISGRAVVTRPGASSSCVVTIGSPAVAGGGVILQNSLN